MIHCACHASGCLEVSASSLAGIVKVQVDDNGQIAQSQRKASRLESREYTQIKTKDRGSCVPAAAKQSKAPEHKSAPLAPNDVQMRPALRGVRVGGWKLELSRGVAYSPLHSAARSTILTSAVPVLLSVQPLRTACNYVARLHRHIHRTTSAARNFCTRGRLCRSSSGLEDVDVLR